MSESSKRHARRTVARHGQLPKSNPVRQALAFVAIALSTVLVAGLGVIGYIVYDLTSTFASENTVDLDGQTEAPAIAELDNRGFNILLAGLDVCDWEHQEIMGNRCSDDPDDYGENGLELDSARSDVLMLMHISPAPRRVTVVSFPRDLVTYIPRCEDEEGNVGGDGREMINAAYSYGGLSCTVSAVEELTGQTIDHAASVTWGGVIDITNAIGGVTVCVAGGIHDPKAGAYFEAGENTISGDRALAFLRTRAGVDDGSDIARISNQQVFMSALVNKVVSPEVLGNMGTVYNLARAVVENIEKTPALADPIYLAQLALAVKDVQYQDFVFVQYPVFVDPADANRRIPDEESATQLFEAINANVPIQVTAEGTGSVSEDEAQGGTGEGEQAPPPEENVAPPEGTAAAPEDGAAPTPEESAGPVELGSNIPGQTAADRRCSAGNAG
ncbi:hypothetical protein GCM10027064_05060 [Microbacterium petrolearium]